MTTDVVVIGESYTNGVLTGHWVKKKSIEGMPHDINVYFRPLGTNEYHARLKYIAEITGDDDVG